MIRNIGLAVLLFGFSNASSVEAAQLSAEQGGASKDKNTELGSHDTVITGDTEINASFETTVPIAGGNGATAQINTGTITGSTIAGDTTFHAMVENVLSAAIGDGATAMIEAGAINRSRIDGETTLYANDNKFPATAGGKDSCASVRVGAFGPAPCLGSWRNRPAQNFLQALGCIVTGCEERGTLEITVLGGKDPLPIFLSGLPTSLKTDSTISVHISEIDRVSVRYANGKRKPISTCPVSRATEFSATVNCAPK